MEEPAVKLAESYKGVMLDFHYDDRTRSYFGVIDDLPVVARFRVSTYKELVETFRRTVDESR
jgi:hypothetical protein